MDDQLIADLKAKYPDAELHVIGNEFGRVVVRGPSEEEWARFTDEYVDPSLRRVATRTLLNACVVYPDAKAFQAMIAKRPGLANTFGNELAEIGGLKAVTERKKL